MTILQIKVKPNARESVLAQNSDGTWQAGIKSPPIEGRANQELVALVARHLKLPKARVTIKSGASGRIKLVHIDDT